MDRITCFFTPTHAWLEFSMKEASVVRKNLLASPVLQLRNTGVMDVPQQRQGGDIGGRAKPSAEWERYSLLNVPETNASCHRTKTQNRYNKHG